jgi:hypothetical protein
VGCGALASKNRSAVCVCVLVPNQHIRPLALVATAACKQDSLCNTMRRSFAVLLVAGLWGPVVFSAPEGRAFGRKQDQVAVLVDESGAEDEGTGQGEGGSTEDHLVGQDHNISEWISECAHPQPNYFELENVGYLRTPAMCVPDGPCARGRFASRRSERGMGPKSVTRG